MELTERLLPIPEHCYQLCKILGDDEFRFNHNREGKTKDEELVCWQDVSNSLHLASSIRFVDIDTASFDQSAMYCEGAWKYEAQVSDLYHNLVENLITFNLTWSCLETLVKVISPPRIPKQIKSRSGPIDEATFYLKNFYEPTNLPPLYLAIISEFRDSLDKSLSYKDLSKEFKLEKHFGISGLGLIVVRKIRNKIVHGILNLKEYQNNGATAPLDTILLTHSIRIVLCSIQMLLIAFLKTQKIEFKMIILNEWGDEVLIDIKELLLTVHIKKIETDQDQMVFFDSSPNYD